MLLWWRSCDVSIRALSDECSLEVFKLTIKVCHSAQDVLPLPIPQYTTESSLSPPYEVAVTGSYHLSLFSVVLWNIRRLPAGIWASAGISTAIKLPFSIQNRFKVLTLNASNQPIVSAHWGPFHPGSVDIVPPAFARLSPVVGSPLALEVPQAVRAFFLTEVTLDCH